MTSSIRSLGRAWLVVCLAASCADEGALPEPSDFGESEGTFELVSAMGCNGAEVCTGHVAARTQCFAAMQDTRLRQLAAQTFDVPHAGSYAYVRLVLQRFFSATDGAVRIELRELVNGDIDGGTVLGTASIAGALIAREPGTYAATFSPAIQLDVSNAATPRYALVVSAVSGRLAVGVACASDPGALPGGDGFGRRRTLQADTSFSTPAWRKGARDLAFSLGALPAGSGPCATVVGAQCDDGNATSGDGCSASCTIEPGFTCVGAPATCTDTDGCLASTCFAGVTCTDVAAPGVGFTCGACPAGYTGNGTTCIDPDGCASSPCFAGVSCVDVPAPGLGFTCGACPAGYSGDGVTCTNFDACASNPCFSGVTCTDLAPPSTSFTCGACPSGYTGNGVTCTNFDACASNPCFSGVTCTDLAPPSTSFTCGACPAGYSGNGVTCTNFDACASNPCFSGVTCTDLAPPSTSFTCGACPAGYTGNGVTCTNFDACASNPCFSGVTCTDLAPPSTSFTCGACPSGYTGNGVTCTPTFVAGGTYTDLAAADADGLQSYFRFDESECCILADSMGRGSGWVFAGTAQAAQVGGGWFRGAGADGGFRLDVPTADHDTFSVSFWWKPTDMTMHASNDGAGILWMSPDSASRIIGMNGLPSANRLRWGAFPNSSSMDANYTLTQNAWHHIVITQTGPQAANLYVNGSLVAQSSAYAFRVLQRMYVNNYLESTAGNTNNHYGRGIVDELAFWNRVLSATEVSALRTAQAAGTPLFTQPAATNRYANQAAAATDGVRAYFRFDETTGTTLTDSMGNYSGTVLGGNASTGKVGGAWFRGSTASHGFRLDLPGMNLSTFTVAFWWKPTDMTYYASSDGAGIIWMTPDAAANVIGMNGLPSTNRLRFGNFPNASSFDGNFNLLVNTWHHFALTVTGGTTARLYVNGVERASSTSRTFAIGPTIYIANYTVLGNTNPHYGRGNVDELAIWNRALTAAEMRAIALKGLAGRPLF